MVRVQPWPQHKVEYGLGDIDAGGLPWEIRVRFLMGALPQCLDYVAPGLVERAGKKPALAIPAAFAFSRPSWVAVGSPF